MKITILLDNHLDDRANFLHAGWRETGWEQLLSVEFLRLRDVGLLPDCPDHEIWRFVQQHHMYLLTSNRNRKDETSLEATIERENTPTSLPVLTLSHAERLANPVQREPLIYALADILIHAERTLGAGRLYIS